ncbi:CZB domain-containing protein [Catenovulum maritimum]|uniref:Chemoreceptor zinc-binding domain-containing protein n=1 Tax=Catenovulum maritimum TaxID=1513271 RepID=A0A0J8GU34_9ALTE|nr:CZB domain-containing protein [Catenovulum maritimum]KMT64198.1 hypothetical protein XM47_15635 [Catenovulum maritimum]
MEVVNFRVGNRLVAFNILDILLTEKFTNDQTSVPTDDSAFLGVKDFMGVPTPIYDLSIAMNKTSTKHQNKELVELLHLREKDHVDWLDALENTARTGIEFTKAKDPHQCAFGKWYDSFTTTNMDLAEVLKKFDAPHKAIHNLADSVLTLLEQDKQTEALTLIEVERNSTLASLRRLFATARDQVEVTYKPVTVFTTTDGRRPKLGFVVDKVEDSLHVEKDQIRSLDEIKQYTGDIDHRVANMINGLLTAGHTNSILLSPQAFI